MSMFSDSSSISMQRVAANATTGDQINITAERVSFVINNQSPGHSATLPPSNSKGLLKSPTEESTTNSATSTVQHATESYLVEEGGNSQVMIVKSFEGSLKSFLADRPIVKPYEKSSCQIYEEQMFRAGMGHPLLNPSPSDPHHTTGVRIGDIGIVTAFGNFLYICNIWSDPGQFLDPTNLPPKFPEKIPYFWSQFHWISEGRIKGDINKKKIFIYL
ncbi:hypothetical protein BDQ12DRAFT_268324 [Crucibulum laeve]|uniref:Uncharacterized protein n=1 Tax=Crucibulum laeve TaxID=68775 RepID=A0A5C3LDG9_9AGAR|nr:hypothetical protein BDQ12DRAFT_268324 [Crucibulum laeve]